MKGSGSKFIKYTNFRRYGGLFLSNIMPKTIMSRFKKCGNVEVQTTPDGTTEGSTLVTSPSPFDFSDPLVSYGSGVYPKQPALTLLYEKYKAISSWCRYTVSTSMAKDYTIFMYPSRSITASHIATDSYENLCHIPNIIFKKSKRPGLTGEVMYTEIFMRKSQKFMYPREFHDPRDNVADLDAAIVNKVYYHCGIVNRDVDNALAATTVAFSANVGCLAKLYRREELTP